MVAYSLTFRSSLLRRHWRRVLNAFSLLEIVVVLFVLAALSAALVPSLGESLERERCNRENQILAELAATVVASFDQTDLTSLNVAAFPGDIGPSDAPTVFSDSIKSVPAATANGAWFAKLARLRGLSVQVGSPPLAQPALTPIVQNPLGNPRLLFAGPAEAGRQRFLLVSLLGPMDRLSIPAYETGIGWFDAIWNHEWENRTARLPVYWQNRLSPPQTALWHQGNAGLTQVHRFLVRRIVLPRYRITINNNHPTEQAFVSFNNTPNAFTASANSGASQTPEILGGRLIAIHRGPAWPGLEALRFHLRENATVTVQ